MVYLKIDLKKETINPDEMDIKDVGMTWVAVDEIEYNIIGEFQTSDSNTPVYYIV